MLPPIMFSVPVPRIFSGLSLKRVSILALVTAAFGLAACAAVPPSTTDKPVDPATLASTQSLQGQAGAWPSKDWWQGFNDPQLNSLMTEAFAASPDIKAAHARLEKANAFYDQVKAVLSPTVTLNGSIASTKSSLNMGFPDAFKSFLPQGYWYADRLAFDASYDIDLWGKSHAALRGAIGQAKAAELEGEVARQALAQQIARAYVELDRLYQERDDLSEIKTGSDMRVQLVQARLDHNLDDMDTLLRSQDDQAQVAQRLAATSGAIRIQQNLLAALVGAGPDRGLSITRPQLAPVGVDTLPDDIQLNLLGRRPDVQAARLHVEAASDQIKYNKADFYPNLKLNAYFGLQALGKDGLGLSELTAKNSDIGSIGPAISLPLFNGGSLRAAYRSSEADYDSAVATYDQTLTTALHEVADAAANTQSTADQLKAAQLRADTAQKTYDLSKARFGKGIGTKVDVLQAHSSLIAAGLGLTNLKAQAYNDRIRFVAALGGGFQPQ